MQTKGRHAAPSPGIPAPYGHACANCALSKCKCIIHQAGGPCERCRRINKECRPAETVRRRNPRKPAVSKTTRLEKKLDDLVSLIKSGAQSGIVSTSHATTPVDDDSTPSGVETNISGHDRSERILVSSNSNEYCRHTLQALTPATDDYLDNSYSLPSSIFHEISGEPSPVEAEEYLTHFQTHKSKFLPFVNIPSTINAKQLRQEQPFLWFCIMAVSSQSTAQQQLWGSKIRQTVAQQMVVQSVRNVDLLLGLLTFLGWANYHISTGPFLALFAQLTISLVFDLGLNKPVPKDILPGPCEDKYPRRSTPRTMEERRAVLGCFLVTSIISSFVQKSDALRWTSHMNECLQILDENKECPTDRILVQQVRLQILIEKMVLGGLNDGVWEHSKELPLLYVENIYSEVQDLKHELLAQPQIDVAILLHLHSVELEITLSPIFTHTTQVTNQQRKFFDASLASINSWFELFFTISPAAYTGLSFSIFSQLFRCVVTLYRLKTVDARIWDYESIQNLGDPLLILDRVVNNLEQVAALAGLDNSGSHEKDVFYRSAQTFRSLRPGWEAKFSKNDLPTFSTPQNVDETFPPDAITLEFFDNDWLMDLLVPPHN